MTERLVVDANVLAHATFEIGPFEPAVTLLRSRPEMLAPDVLIAECVNTAWKIARDGLRSNGEVHAGLEQLLRAPVAIHDSAPLARAALELALRLGHPGYDCLYLALAIREECRLVTADRRLVERATAAGLGAHVVWVGDAA